MEEFTTPKALASAPLMRHADGGFYGSSTTTVSRTILICFVSNQNYPLEVLCFESNQDELPSEVEAAYTDLKGGLRKPKGTQWTIYNNIEGPNINFGSAPSKVFCLMVASNWKFETNKAAVTSKDTVPNYYTDYKVSQNFFGYIVSFVNNSLHEPTEHGYNVHCLMEILGHNVKTGKSEPIWVPVTIDPKFRNP